MKIDFIITAKLKTRPTIDSLPIGMDPNIVCRKVLEAIDAIQNDYEADLRALKPILSMSPSW